jgi:hypothetical protein
MASPLLQTDNQGAPFRRHVRVGFPGPIYLQEAMRVAKRNLFLSFHIIYPLRIHRDSEVLLYLALSSLSHG